MDNKHSVTKELDVTIEIEDFFDELETSEKKEFLTEQFEDLDVKDQIEVAHLQWLLDKRKSEIQDNAPELAPADGASE